MTAGGAGTVRRPERPERPERPGRPGNIRRIFAIPGYSLLCASSFIWHTTRWGSLFTTTYLLTQMADSPLLNQAAGALMFAPMLLGGVLAGVVSDRFERRRFIMAVQLCLVPVELGMFLLVASGTVQFWHTLPFMFAVGIGGVVNMTAQRPLIYETVGPQLAAPAMSIEATAQAGSAMFGALLGGVLIDQAGLSAGFATMAMLLVVSAGLLSLVPSPRHGTPPAERGSVSVRSQLVAGIGLVRRSQRLVGMLAVTVVMNLFMFGYLPLVPVVAQHLTVSATAVGALAAAPGAGQILCGLILSTRTLSRHGLVFAIGSALALSGLFGFATAPTYGVAMAALLLAGVGQAGFASMQSLLAIESAAVHERGVALGVLSTAIGAMPIGIVLIGLASEPLGAGGALMASSAIGLLMLGVVLLRVRVLLDRNPHPA